MTSEKKSNKMTCLDCTGEYATSSFYSHRNSLINENFGFCKKCVRRIVKVDDMSTLYSILRTMDLPYLREAWIQANESDSETIGMYFKNMSLKQNRHMRFKDSEDMAGKSTKAETIVDENEDFELTKQIIKRWGRNLELEDYISLEEEFENLGGHEAEDTVQERIIKNMAKTQWMANRAYEEGDVVKYEKMMKVLSSQMNDANIKPVQVKNASQDGVLQSWGEWVRHIEEDEPIDELSKEFKDGKFMEGYADRFFITPIKRIFGRASEEDVDKLNGDLYERD